jgi:transposase
MNNTTRPTIERNPSREPIAANALPHSQYEQLIAQIEDPRAALAAAAQVHQQAIQERDAKIRDQAEEIGLLRQFIFGRRRERLVPDPDQGTLFDLNSTGVQVEHPSGVDPERPSPELEVPPQPSVQADNPARRRRDRQLDFDRLPHVRIDHDVPEKDKTCGYCGQGQDRRGRERDSRLCFETGSTKSAR